VIDAIVVLPDHLHAVWTLPPNDADFPGRWKAIKRHFTHALLTHGVSLARNAKGEYSLWQRRYWEHTIRDETDLQRHVDYIHYNPVKHDVVARASAWPFSSFHRYVRLGWLSADWGGREETESEDDWRMTPGLRCASSRPQNWESTSLGGKEKEWANSPQLDCLSPS